MKLVAIDMDGTLLNNDSIIHHENAKTIKKAQEKGVSVVIATGRSYSDAIKPLKDAGLTCPMICVNGANIYTEQGKQIHSVPLSLEMVREITSFFIKLDLYFEVYTDEAIYCPWNGRGKLEDRLNAYCNSRPDADRDKLWSAAQKQFQQAGIVPIHDFDSVFSKGNLTFYKILSFTFDHDQMETLRTKLSDQYDLSISASSQFNIEIMNKHASKGIALKKFAEIHQIPIHLTAAIGDSLNDLSMLHEVAISIAMDNADEEVKQLCELHTKSNEDNGVAHALKYLLNLDEE